jgi:hypothetical protein
MAGEGILTLLVASARRPVCANRCFHRYIAPVALPDWFHFFGQDLQIWTGLTEFTG